MKPKKKPQKKEFPDLPGYPIASIAYYGPDDKFASKVVVGIMLAEEDEDVADLQKWFAHGVDVRMDQAINDEIYKFIDQYKVRRVAMMERIIGCPHEEGINYPLGETCPECTYWAHRDRWTGEITE